MWLWAVTIGLAIALSVMATVIQLKNDGATLGENEVE